MVQLSRVLMFSILGSACGSVNATQNDAGGGSSGGSVDAAGSPDDAGGGPTGSDGSVAQPRCDPSKPFGTPTLVANINSSLDENGFALTRDEKIGFVVRTGPTILIAQRASADVPFDPPASTLTATLNAAGPEYRVATSFDGLILYVSRSNSDPSKYGVYAATRSDPAASFDTGTLVTVDGTALTQAYDATLSADGQTLYWGDISFSQIFAATRAHDAAFINGHLVGGMQAPVLLSADELTAYTSENTAAVGSEIMMYKRETKSAKFGAYGSGTPVDNVNSPKNDAPVALTADGCVLYISSNRDNGVGGNDIWEAHRAR